jgi:MFS family permease
MTGLNATNRNWWILATMTGALSMVLIDETVVSGALPAIQRDLHPSPSGLQWVVNAYLLALAACVAVGGRLGGCSARRGCSGSARSCSWPRRPAAGWPGRAGGSSRRGPYRGWARPR